MNGIDKWEKTFGLLEIYKERENHCNVPQRHKEGGKNLGVWLNSQRARQKKGELSISHIERLEDIGVIWDLSREKWENNYCLLVNFQQREGHANVPRGHKEEGVNLGHWLITQRQQKKKEELDISLEERLENIGVTWNIFKEQWENTYHLLVKFQQREGHANVPFGHKEEGVNLSVWLDKQRSQKKKRKLDIKPEERLKKKEGLDIRLEKRLEDIGVIWDIHKKQWDNSYLLLVKFQHREGHANVPQKHKEEGANLGLWLLEQRKKKRRGLLDISLEERLENIGVIWDAFKGLWESKYLLLVKFKQRKGHANVPDSHKEEGLNLGAWLKDQRDQKRKGKLNIRHKERLEDVGVVWDVFKEKWENNYRHLVTYQRREGHANVHQRHKEEGVNLGTWLMEQRKKKKTNKLDISRERLLTKIGIVWY